ncbi:T9SS type A sorting domain-containing protein [Wenyingzhuangia sp. IMCC45574]
MTKKLLKNVVLGATILTTSFLNAQTVTITPATTNILTSGELQDPIVVTIDNIPDGTDNTKITSIAMRLFNDGDLLTSGDQQASSAETKNYIEKDVDNTSSTVYNTETQTATLGAGYYKKVITYYSYNNVTGTLTLGNDMTAAIRFVTSNSTGLAGLSPSIVFTNSDALTNPTTSAGKRAHFYGTTVTVVATLSSSASKKIEGAIVNAENGSISVSGATLDAIYTITGQKVTATNLASGVYLVKISKGNKQETVKVIL